MSVLGRDLAKSAMLPLLGWSGSLRLNARRSKAFSGRAKMAQNRRTSDEEEQCRQERGGQSGYVRDSEQLAQTCQLRVTESFALRAQGEEIRVPVGHVIVDDLCPRVGVPGGKQVSKTRLDNLTCYGADNESPKSNNRGD
jgi:hypothetical protein